MTQTKEGVVIWCPFCVPSHPITPGQSSVCGTQLKLTAVQTVIPARVARIQKITCAKCHQTGEGDMVQYGSGFIHLQDCMPQTNLLREPVKYSKLAGWIFHLPVKVRAVVCSVTRQYPQEVHNITDDKVIGYYFIHAAPVKQKGQSHATRQTSEPAA